MSSELVQALAGFFANSHGQYLKCAYAETLIHLLHPVIETATAEVNHPMWSKAIAVILQRASAMLSKPRYWSIGFSLFVVTLGVSPREVFMQHWQTCIDNIQARFKVSGRQLQWCRKLISGPYNPLDSHGRFHPSPLDLPQPVCRIVYIDAKTTRSVGSVFSLLAKLQSAGAHTRAICRNIALHHDSTPRLRRGLYIGLSEPIVWRSRGGNGSHDSAPARTSSCGYQS